MQLPKVSVIIPVYNRIEFLSDAIDSALNQTLLPFEILVVSDGSGLALQEKIAELVDAYTIARLICLPSNKGVSHARNVGLGNAQGEFIVFLDDDDFLEKSLLHAAVSHFMSHQETDVFISRARLFSTSVSMHFKRVQKFYIEQQQQYHHLSTDHPDYFLVYCPAIHSMVFRKSCLPIQPFPEDLQYGEDRWMLLNLRKLGVKFYVSDLLGAHYTIHERVASVSQKNRIRFSEALLSSGFLVTINQRSYVYLLRGYFLLSAKKWGAGCQSILRSLNRPNRLWHFVLLYLRTRY